MMAVSVAANVCWGECCGTTAAAADSDSRDRSSAAQTHPQHRTFSFNDSDQLLDRSNHSLLIMPGSEQGRDGSIVANPYHVLQIRRDATLVEIRQAYRRLALRHHPGRCCGGTSSVVERQRRLHIFTLVAASYETLADPGTRGRCDALLRQQQQQHRQSNVLPAGQVHVGGKPVFACSGHGLAREARGETSQQTTGQNLMARVMEHFHGEGAGILPTVTPVSSDSSIDESLIVRHTDYDDDDDSTVESRDRPFIYSTPNKESTRIHYPLGTPIGSPQHRLAHQEEIYAAPHSSATKKTQEPERPRSFFRCGVESLTSFDTQPLVIKSDSTMDGLSPQTKPLRQQLSKGEMHYSVGDTNRLFGGPLQLMYRARRWKSFEDPHKVFATVFGTGVSFGPGPETTFAGSPPTAAIATKGTASFDEQHHPHTAEWSGASEILPDGTMVFTTSRTLQNRKLTRTETVWVDPDTQIRHSKVHVYSEVLSIAEEHTPETNAGWSVGAFFAELMDPCVEEECQAPDASCGTCTTSTRNVVDENNNDDDEDNHNCDDNDTDAQTTEEEDATVPPEESQGPYCGALCSWFD